MQQLVDATDLSLPLRTYSALESGKGSVAGGEEVRDSARAQRAQRAPCFLWSKSCPAVPLPLLPPPV